MLLASFEELLSKLVQADAFDMLRLGTNLHGFDDAIGFQLAIHLADRVAMQAGLHRQLTGAGQSVSRGVMPRCDREANLVVQLGRCRNVAFLLDVESHAGRPGWNAATLRSESPGDNWLGVP